MDENKETKTNAGTEEPQVEMNNENKKNWKQVAKNWGRRLLWAGIGVGATLGIQALKNRKKNAQ